MRKRRSGEGRENDKRAVSEGLGRRRRGGVCEERRKPGEAEEEEASKLV